MIEKDIHNICKQFNITKYTINEDHSIDVDGNVYLWYKGLNEIPLKFNKVNGFFDCGFNNLISLEGSPREVTDYFNCDNNKLESLKGAPLIVKELHCNNNNLTSLEYLPDIKGTFHCEGNPVTNFIKGKSIKEIKNYYKLKKILK
jgi:Leucine-rich repeat (LRR) protein